MWKNRRWLLLMALGLFAPEAGAAVTRVVFVVVPTEEKAERKALELQLGVAEALSMDPRLELLDPATRYAPQVAERTTRQLDDAHAALEDVRAMVGRVEYAEARTRAESALTELRTGDFRVLKTVTLELLVQLASVKNALEVDDRGEAELSQALVIEPKLEPLRGWNSKERARFSAVQKTVASGKARPVRLEASSGTGWVWLDGRLLGLTPVTVSDVRPGRHFLTFVALGAEAEHRSEQFGSIESVVFTPVVTAEGRNYRAILASVASGFLQGEPVIAATELLTWARADEVMVVAVSQGAGAKVFRFSAVGRVPMTEVAVATPQAVAEAVKQAFERRMEQPAVEAALPMAAAPVQSTTKEKVHRSRVPGVVLLSLAAAAVAAGTVLVLAGKNAYADANATIPQVEDVRYRQAVSASNTLSAVGLGAFGGAAVSAVVGLALVW